jgi:transcription initiation factor TFIIIB Brf1 subunit/transcription initiation factor TFIIB
MLFDHCPECRAFDEEQREKRIRVGAPLKNISLLRLLWATSTKIRGN